MFLRSSRSALSLICVSSFLIRLSISWHFCAIFCASVTTPRAAGLLWLQYHLIASLSLSDRKLYAASVIFLHLAWSQWSHRSHFRPCSPSRTCRALCLLPLIGLFALFVLWFCLSRYPFYYCFDFVTWLCSFQLTLSKYAVS